MTKDVENTVFLQQVADVADGVYVKPNPAYGNIGRDRSPDPRPGHWSPGRRRDWASLPVDGSRAPGHQRTGDPEPHCQPPARALQPWRN